MNIDTGWLDYLRTQGAQLAPDGEIEGFGSTQRELGSALNSVALVALAHLAVLRVSGADARSFLQAQLTSDLDAVSATIAGFSGYCTPKGRLLATPLVLMQGHDYLLVLPRALAEPLAARLARYVLRAKVQIGSDSELCLLGLVGPEAASALEQSAGHAPRRSMEAISLADAIAVAIPENRCLLVCRAADAQTWWSRLRTSAGPAGAGSWEVSGIRAAIAWVLPQTQELFLPQTLGLERYGAVSFSKGCYPGQEIVARTEYLGELKRRLCRGRSPTMAQAGDAIFALNGPPEAVGVVANAAPSPDGGVEVLAVVQRDSIQQPLRLGEASGAPLILDGVTLSAAASRENSR